MAALPPLKTPSTTPLGAATLSTASETAPMPSNHQLRTRNGRAIQGDTAMVAATARPTRTETGSGGGPTAMAASHNDREAPPVA
jgi:hypothetical protein